MDLVDQINRHTYLLLAEIGEPNDNVLRLVIEEARASDLVEDVVIGDVTIPDTRAIISDDLCFAYEIIFGSYVSYSVRNESYTPEDRSEEFTGRLFRSYTRSRFRDYVSVATFATDDYPGKLIHYEVVCENHIVDIVSIEEPEISVIRRAQQELAADSVERSVH
jgi:hypothetical protein